MKQDIIALIITAVLAIFSAVFLATIGVENIGEFIVLLVLCIDGTCFPCAYLYHFYRYKNGESNLINLFPARSGLLMLFFTSPYFFVKWIIS